MRAGRSYRVGATLIAVAAVGLALATFLPWTRPISGTVSGWQLINLRVPHQQPSSINPQPDFVLPPLGSRVCGLFACTGNPRVEGGGG
jgi:hypothetical protein